MDGTDESDKMFLDIDIRCNSFLDSHVLTGGRSSLRRMSGKHENWG